MFQGRERLGEWRGCRGLFVVVIALIFMFAIKGESSMTACRTEPEAWIFFRFLWLRCRSGVLILFYHPSHLTPLVVFVPSLYWIRAGVATLTSWDIHPSIFFSPSLRVLPQMAEPELLLLLYVWALRSASPKHSSLVEGLALPLEAAQVWEAWKLESDNLPPYWMFPFLKTSFSFLRAFLPAAAEVRLWWLTSSPQPFPFLSLFTWAAFVSLPRLKF